MNSKKIKFRFSKCDFRTIFQKYKYYLNWGTPADKRSHSFLYKIAYLTSVNTQLRERLKMSMVKLTPFQYQVSCGNSCLVWPLHLLKEMRAQDILLPTFSFTSPLCYWVRWMPREKEKKTKRKHYAGASIMVAQRVRIRPPTQATQVRSLVRDDPTCLEQLSPWATTAEPVLSSPQATTTEPTHPGTCAPK